MTTRLTLVCAAHDGTGGFGADRPAAPRLLALAARRVVPPAGARLFVAAGRCSADTALAAGWAGACAADLAEADAGAWAGLSIETAAARDPQLFAAWVGDPCRAPPGGESLAAVAARASRWLAVQARQGGRAAAIAPATVIRAAIIAAIEAPPAMASRIDIPPLSLTRLTHDGRRWTWRAGN